MIEYTGPDWDKVFEREDCSLTDDEVLSASRADQ